MSYWYVVIWTIINLDLNRKPWLERNCSDETIESTTNYSAKFIIDLAYKYYPQNITNEYAKMYGNPVIDQIKGTGSDDISARLLKETSDS